MIVCRHWYLRAVAATLIGVLSLLVVEIDVGLEEAVPPNPDDQPIPDLQPEKYGDNKILMGH